VPRLPENLDVLRDGAFVRLLGAAAVSWLGDRMVNIALAFAVLELDGDASDIGVVLASRNLPLVACLLLGGVVADRVSRRAIMVTADVARLLTQGLLAGLLIAGEAEIWTVALLSGLSGAAGGFFNPASTGLLPAIVPPERLQQANGVRATAMSAGEIGGPVLAGALVAAVGAGWALAVDAGTFAVSALLLTGVRVPPRTERAATRFLADLRDGWHTFRGMTWVWTFVAWAAVANVTWGAWGVLGPVLAERDLGGAAAWGAIQGALGVGALLGALGAIRQMPRRPVFAAALTAFVQVPALALLAAGAPAVPVAAGALVFGIGMMFGNTVWEAAVQRHVPAESLSRVSAYDWFGSLAFAPLGLIIWGPVAERIGIAEALWLSAGISLVSAVLLLCVRDVRAVR
jgi:MFS family permease